MNKKIRLSKDAVTKKSYISKNRLVNSILFILIFLLTVSTIVTIQIRSEKNRTVQNSSKASTLTVSDEIINEQPVANVENTNSLDKQNIVQTNEPTKPDDESFILPYNGEIIKSFSDTELIYSNTMDDWRIHCGVDIKVSENAEIVSMSSGKVCDMIKDDIYGTTLVVDHGLAVVKYSNIDVYDNIKIDYDVSAGQSIGKVSSNPMCEISDDLHIHLEAYKNDVVINPLDLIK